MLIKIEALNIYRFINEAENLNAIRGGGLMLLDMPTRFKNEWTQHGSVATITEGASKAVFRVQTEQEAAVIEESAFQWLREHYPYATIGVAVIADDREGFFAADEKMSAMIRQQQMRSFSIAGAFPAEASEVCEWDHVRPATARRIHAKHSSFLVSESTAARYKYGRDNKRTFLHKHAGVPGDWEYTWDMDELSAWSDAGNLNHKVAVFYADGNQFTKLLRNQLEKSPADHQETVIGAFDNELQSKRKVFLSEVLKATDAGRWQTLEKKRRIEVLLWGGDELMLVVPAWCGWEVARLFSSVMKSATFQSGHVRVPLKHAMGLIFAHHKAPIHALTRLVRDLSDEAKKIREHDRLSYLVLESFDHIGEDLARFRALRCPDEAVRNAMTLSMEEDSPAEIERCLKSLKDAEFPRRKVFQAVLGMSREMSWDKLKADIEPFVTNWRADLNKWQTLTGGEQAAWYHLSELWDYIGCDL